MPLWFINKCKDGKEGERTKELDNVLPSDSPDEARKKIINNIVIGAAHGEVITFTLSPKNEQGEVIRVIAFKEKVAK